MAKKDRTGERRSRDQHKRIRVPELGYYLIVTDTEGTERCFFEGLRAGLPKEVQDKLVVKVIETRTENLIEMCLEYTAYDPQYRLPWIVFDRDRVIGFDKIIAEAKEKAIKVGWSNPCFEIWMYAYYGQMPNIQDSWTCCEKFGELFRTKTGNKYDKADKNLYHRLMQTGDENRALNVAKQKYKQCLDNGFTIPSQMCPCTTVHELVGEIRGKANI